MLIMPMFGAEQDGLINDLGLAASYTSAQVGPALAELTLTVTTSGTLTLAAGSGDSLTGSPTSVTWLSFGSAADYEVQFTTSGLVNSPTVTNGASTWTAVSANRSIKVEKNNDIAEATVLVEIRRTVNPTRTLSDSTALIVNGSP